MRQKICLMVLLHVNSNEVMATSCLNIFQLELWV